MIRFLTVALLAAMLAGCSGSARETSFVSGVEDEAAPTNIVPASLTTEATPSRWSVTCAQMGKKRMCSTLLTMSDYDNTWLQVGALRGEAGDLTLGFSVPLETKEFGSIFVTSDNGVESILKLRQCTPKNCYTTWSLMREQKEQLLGGKELNVDYALNSGVNKRFTLSLQELRGSLTKLASQ